MTEEHRMRRTPREKNTVPLDRWQHPPHVSSVKILSTSVRTGEGGVHDVQPGFTSGSRDPRILAGMKWLFVSILALSLVACTNSEVDSLRQENARLKMQLEAITRERDDLKTQLDSVRAALDQPPGSTDSSDAGSSSTDPNSAGSSDPTSGSAGSSDMGAGSTEPQASGTTPSDAGTASSNSGQATSQAVTTYAQDVIKAAAAYATSTGSTAPEDCTNGYEAGSSKLALGAGISLKSCKVVNESGQLHVEIEAMDGSTAKVSSTGP